MRGMVFGTLAILALCGAGFAEDEVPAGPEFRAGLEFTLTPGVWLPRTDGSSALGGRHISLDSDFDLDDADNVFAAEFGVRKRDRWNLRFGGFDSDVSSDGPFSGSNKTWGGVPLTDGMPIDTRLDMTSAWFDISFDLRLSDSEPVDPGYLRIAPMVGFRYVEVKQSLDAPTGSAKGEGTWLIPEVGLDVEVRFYPDGALPVDLIQLEAAAAIGPAVGGDGGFVVTVGAGIRVQVTPAFGFLVGYRLIEIEAEDGDFEFHGGLQGLFLAGSVRF